MADQVDEVKQKVDIVSVIGEYIQVRKAGKNYKALCPFHGEKTPSFMISPELQMYKCFGCFPAGELVKTPFGLHKIEEVANGEFAISGKGKIKKVLATHEREYKGALITVRLSKLTEPVRLTDDHMVYVVSGAPTYSKNYKNLSRRLNFYKKKYQRKQRLAKIWKYFPVKKIKAGNLRKKMTLLYPLDFTVRDIKTIDLSKYITKKWPPHGTKPLIPPLQIEVGEELLKLIGYYIAEGSNHRAYIRFSLGNHEEEFAKEILELVKDVFGIEASIYRRTTQENKTGLEITACNSILANVFENLCGKGAENKHTPFVFQQLPKEKQSILLEAIFRGDGYERIPHKTKNTYREIITISRVLSEQLRDILLRLGYFPSSLEQKEKRDAKMVSHKKAYTLNWPVQSEVSKFRHIYEDQDGVKYWLLPVREAKKRRFRGKVHNLTIEGDHSYVANTFAVANCGEAGDAFTFLQKYDGMDFGEALRVLAERAGIKLETYRAGEAGEKEKFYEINSLAAKFYNYILLNHAAGKPALNYLLKERELSPETIKTFQIGFSPDVPGILKRFLVDKKGYKIQDLEKLGLIINTGGRALDKFRGRIIFPLMDHRGNIAGFTGRIMPGGSKELAKYVNSPESPVYHKSSNLYGLNLAKGEIKNKTQAIVVEGQMDMVSCFQAGVANVVAIGGTSLTDDQARLLSRFTKKIIMALDSDFAGDLAARRGIVVAQKQGLEISVARFGTYKDPDEAVRGDFNAFQKAIDSSVDVWDYIIDSVIGKADTSSGEGKARVSREIVPVLSSIPDRIVQAHYIEVVARKLGVPQEAVGAEVEAVKEDSVEKKIEQIDQPKEIEKTRRQLLEERLLTMTFQSDPTILLKEKVRKLIATPLTNRLVEEYAGYRKHGKDFSPSAFAERLPKELVDGFAEMVLRDTEGLVEDKEHLRRELELVLSELEKEDINLRQEKLGVKIREFEQEGQKKELEKAIKKYDELSIRKKQLEEEGNRGIILSEA